MIESTSKIPSSFFFWDILYQFFALNTIDSMFTVKYIYFENSGDHLDVHLIKIIIFACYLIPYLQTFYLSL